jgi:phosphoribosylaminoimidazole-succinocarboxamide synthase
MTTLMKSDIAGHQPRRGKVRDIYDLGDCLVLVATDRISAFDWVLPTPIPDKGRTLTALTLFWLNFLEVPHHLVSTRLADMGPAFAAQPAELEGRCCLVRKTRVTPIECVVRGYLAGSGWKEYQENGRVCDIPLPVGLQQAQQLSQPIFTPATKEENGHDQNISFERMVEITGPDLAATLRQRSIDLYRKAARHARSVGILLADTKFEWGQTPQGELLLIDEVLTPDSSRFWPADSYRIGANPPSFDKQFVRDWLESTNWDKNSLPPELPAEVVERTRQKYQEALQRLAGVSPGR